MPPLKPRTAVLILTPSDIILRLNELQARFDFPSRTATVLGLLDWALVRIALEPEVAREVAECVSGLSRRRRRNPNAPVAFHDKRPLRRRGRLTPAT